MALFDVVRTILGIKPVNTGELARSVSLPASRPRSRRAKPAQSVADIDVIHEYTQVRALIESNVPLIFVSGGAGTGKSTLIRYLQNALNLRMAVVAPTGVAALNAGGTTIHSFFHFPPRIIQPSDVKRVRDRKLYRALDLLIIDEVSMVRPDLLDAAELFLRKNRDRDEPFGGVQVLLIGDLFQLPPVVDDEEEIILRQMNYQTRFFFGSHGLSESPLVPVLLERVFRQSDASFIDLLMNIRVGEKVSETLETINARHIGPSSAQERELTLTTTNRIADGRNDEQLAQIDQPTHTFEGQVTGNFRIGRSSLPSPMNLSLKIGAQVMVTKNDKSKLLVNGTIGTVTEIEERRVWVEVENAGLKRVVEIEPVSWEKYKYEYDEDKDRIVSKVVGSYTQIPLMLAWAVTIHKAQGRTLDRVLVDLGNRAFDSGQVYVALSRVRALHDLRLSRPIAERDVMADPRVIEFYSKLREMTRIPE